MVAIQIIKSPSGEELVVLSRKDYDRLIAAAEDARDIFESSIIMDRVRAGEEEIYSIDLIKRLENENPVKVWREYRGLTQAELANQIGTSSIYISQIETGRRAGSIKLLRKIATALGVDIDDIAPSA